MNALLESAQSAGIKICKDSMDADAAVIWSVLWNGRMQLNQQVYNYYRNQDKPIIIVEIGSLHRGITWKIAINNVTSNGYYGHFDDLDWDRPNKLNIKLGTVNPNRPDIVIALQHTKSMQVETIPDMSKWLIDTIQLIKQNTDRPIRVRPHPRCKIIVPTDVVVEIPKQVVGTYDSFDIRYDCHAVVNYNSGPGIQAAIAGIRPVVDVSSLAHPVSVTVSDIEQPYTVDRELWITQICHTEYTIEEIKKGLWLTRLQINK